MNKEDKKEKNSYKLIVIIILLLFTLINIGYANFSSTLKIFGSGGIGQIKWDIHFENIVEDVNNTEVIEPATIQENTANIEYNINLLAPGSYYKFYTDIKNDGTIDAKLATPPTLSGISAEQDAYINYMVTYADGTAIEVGDTLSASESKQILVTVELEKDLSVDQLPLEPQQLYLTIDLNYVQAD